MAQLIEIHDGPRASVAFIFSEAERRLLVKCIRAYQDEFISDFDEEFPLLDNLAQAIEVPR